MDRDFGSGLIDGLNKLRAARASRDKAAVEAAGLELDRHVGSMEKLFRFLDERRRQVRPSLTVEQIIEWIDRESRRPSRWSIATWGMMSEDFEFEAMRRWLEQAGEAVRFSEPNRVAYNASDPAYYSNTEAIRDAHKVGTEHENKKLQELDPDKLKRFLRSVGCTIRFMSQRPQDGQPRGRVHQADWQRYLKSFIQLDQLAQDHAEKILLERLEE